MSRCVGQASLGVHLTVCVVCYAAKDWLSSSNIFVEIMLNRLCNDHPQGRGKKTHLGTGSIWCRPHEIWNAIRKQWRQQIRHDSLVSDCCYQSWK